MKLKIKESRCIKCRLCAKVCPTGAMKFTGDTAFDLVRVFNSKQCWTCGMCVRACPKGVLSIHNKLPPETEEASHGIFPDGLKNEMFSQIKNHSVKVIKKQYLTADVIKLVLELKKPVDFMPGQFAVLKYKTDMYRPYSIANKPGENKLEFLIKLIDGGFGSKFVRKLQVNDRFDVELPFGRFVYKKENNDKNCLFVVTGTGLAPAWSMIEERLSSDSLAQTTLVFGVRFESDLFYVKEIQELQEKYPNFKTYFTVSKPSGPHFKPQRVTDLIGGLAEAGWKYYATYICGSGAMIHSAHKSLRENNLSEKVYYEVFI